jgi:murein DD-endopeptidase MepM/ murein hydrolase activator NlpD
MKSALSSALPTRVALLALSGVLVGFASTGVNAQTTHRTTTATHHAAAEANSGIIRNLFWQPNQLQQGSPAFFTVELDRTPVRVTGRWLGKTITFFRSAENGKLWHALAGDDLLTQPGSYDIVLTATLPGGRVAHSTKPITIAPGDFKTGEINVPENYVNPTDAEQKQIAGDELLKRRAFAHRTPHPLWSGDFLKPVPAASTRSFGESRILNEERTSLHTGTDFPVQEGTPALVSNSGVVVLTRELFYEGNCVIVDHGDGLFTVYMHLSRIDVHEGARLEKGARIGLSGASGRVTGPHLHMGVRWNGSWLDPVQLLALTLPKLQSPTRHARHPGTPRSPHR